MSAPRLLVIGGSGFLGRHTVQWARGSGLDVHATYLTHGPESGVEIERWHHCDILDTDSVEKLFSDVTPTAVINTAYRQNGERAGEICSTGAHNIAAASATAGARIVHISTDLVFDGNLGHPYREQDLACPISDYGRAKLRGEELVTAANDDSIIARTSIIYGRPDAPQERLVERAVREGGISFFTDEWRNPGHVEHLAAAVGKLATELTTTGVLHVAGTDRVNRLQFAQFLAASMDLDPSGLTGGPADRSLGPRPSDVSLDTTAAAALGLALPGLAK